MEQKRKKYRFISILNKKHSKQKTIEKYNKGNALMGGENERIANITMTTRRPQRQKDKNKC